MINHIYIWESFGFDPHKNLATEKFLLDHVKTGECILYLWQNQNTVVIGRNQNAWAECRSEALESAGGKLARRLSGGGAVFHDIGNLNFTFLVPEEDYDVDRQLEVIRVACGYAGIDVEKSGRNDLLAQGHKFSGNAFYHAGGKAYHHGTIMIDVDMSKLTAYLSPPKAKLEAKGVASVRSRVINLKELAPELTCGKMRELMKKAFSRVYGLTLVPFSACDDGEIDANAALYGSWEYLYGTPLPATASCEAKFPWGYIQIQLVIGDGSVQKIRVYTDAMDWALAEKVQKALIGCRFRREDMENALSGLEETVGQDIIGLLSDNIM